MTETHLEAGVEVPTVASSGPLSTAGGRDVDAALERDVCRWIEHEADLLDAADYHTWEELWEPDGHYWLPISPDHEDPELFVSLIFDDRAALARRVERITGRLAYALQPPAQVSRMLGNTRIRQRPDDTLVAVSRFMLLSSRRGINDVLGGRVRHVLRRRGDGFGLVLKRVDLVGADAAFENFTVLL